MTRLKREYDNLPPDTPEIERLSEALDRVLAEERLLARLATIPGPPTIGPNMYDHMRHCNLGPKLPIPGESEEDE